MPDPTSVVRRLDMFDTFITTRERIKLPEGAEYWFDAKADIAAEIRRLHDEVKRLEAKLSAVDRRNPRSSEGPR